MTNPTAYPDIEITNTNQIFETEITNQNVEQSSIYKDINFTVLERELDGICISPQCEIGKSDRMQYLTFCPLFSLESFLVMQLYHYDFSEDELMGKVDLSPDKRKKAKELYSNISKYYMNNQTHRYHYLLGNSDNIKDYIIDFQITECLSAEMMKKYTKILVLKPPFREDIPTRFGSFISRVGTAPIPKKLLKDRIISQNIPIFNQFKK